MSESSHASPDVIVVGGGITGLTVAYELTRRGKSRASCSRRRRAPVDLIRHGADGRFHDRGGARLAARRQARRIRSGRANSGSTPRCCASARPARSCCAVTSCYRLPSPSLLGLAAHVAGAGRLRPAAVGRAAAAGARAARTSRGSDADESVGAFFRAALRSRHRRSHCAAAARRHSRRRHRAVVDAVALPAPAGARADRGQRAPEKGDSPLLWRKEGTAAGRFAVRVAARRDGHARRRACCARCPRGPCASTLPVDRVEPSDRWLARFRERCQPPGTRALRLRRAGARRRRGCCNRSTRRAADALRARAIRVDRQRGARLAAGAVAHPLDGTGFVVARRHSDVRITAATWVSAKWDARAPADAVAHPRVPRRRARSGGRRLCQMTTWSRRPAGPERRDRDRGARRRSRASSAGATPARSIPSGTCSASTRSSSACGAIGGLYVAGQRFPLASGIPDCVADARRIAAAIAETTLRRAHGCRHEDHEDHDDHEQTDGLLAVERLCASCELGPVGVRGAWSVVRRSVQAVARSADTRARAARVPGRARGSSAAGCRGRD